MRKRAPIFCWSGRGRGRGRDVRDVIIIGVASGHGARDPRCEDGPDALTASGPVWCLAHADGLPPAYEVLRPLPNARTDVLPSIVELNRRLAELVRQRVGHGDFPVVIGGDHSCAVGTWSGVRAACTQGPLGLLWIDAHMDSHVPQTSPSGALHGMPLACLLGHGVVELTRLAGPAPKVLPVFVFLLGVCCFVCGVVALLRVLGVRVIFMEEVVRRGFAAAWRDALAHVTRGTAAYGITIDLDAVDPHDAPGVGSPAPGGIGGDGLVQALTELQTDARLVALEIAEYNPHRDESRTTLNLLRRMLRAAGVGKEQDEPHNRARAAILRP